jgi:hypothetical protein
MKIEIGQYREMKKPGPLKAFFTLCIYDKEGADRQYTDCQYFVSGDRQWWTFAQKMVPQGEGVKPKYFAYTKYMNRAYADNLQITVLQALQNKSRESNEQPNNFSSPFNTAQNQVQAEAPFGW